MTTGFIPFTAFFLGLLGSVHCAVMCGGISGYFHQAQSQSASMRFSVSLMAGRLCSYAVAGALAAGFGGSLVGVLGEQLSSNLMQVFVGLFLILLGISLTGLWNGLSGIEKVGARFWKLISPLSSCVIPITNFRGAFLAGALWGWLPCGLVYSALVLVMGAENSMLGAFSMVAFGLGTTPVLAIIGLSSQGLKLKGKPWIRRTAGAAVILLGVSTFTGLLLFDSAHH